jgi:hypothetical protein
MSFLRPFADWVTSACPATEGASVGRLGGTRTTVAQTHNYQWLGSFGNRGNGRYQEELRKGISAIGRYLETHQLSPEHTLLRLDGQYGNGTVLSNVARFAFVTCSIIRASRPGCIYLLIRYSSVLKVRWSAASETVFWHARWQTGVARRARSEKFCARCRR